METNNETGSVNMDKGPYQLKMWNMKKNQSEKPEIVYIVCMSEQNKDKTKGNIKNGFNKIYKVLF